MIEGNRDLERVGGKNASLGEMISQLSDLGVSVPGGFATTSAAFREFLAPHLALEGADRLALSAIRAPAAIRVLSEEAPRSG